MPLFEAYENRRLLVTGTTGFLGKVLLEKLLYTLPTVKCIYVLIRAKKGSKLNERFKRQILESPCFDRLRERHGYNFDKFIEEKVRPIQGDLLKEGLGLSVADLKELSENCEIIMNCAASIDFNARLDDAININIKGTFRMMELAKKCQRLLTFTHVSTCYVNCNLQGRIREEIYPKNSDPDVELKNLLAIPSSEIVRRTDEVLQNYPNTYTFTKALCERLLQKHRGNLPLCIVRPAIINSSYRQPFEGWVDSPAAASAIYLYGGLGLVREVFGNYKLIGDNIPCDIVVGIIVVATAYHMGKNQLEVYNAGSSDRNPVTWGDCRDIVNTFWNTNQSSVKMGKAQVLITNDKQEFRYNRLKRRLPAVIYNRLATMLGSKEHIKTSGKILKSLDKGYQIEEIFRFFVANEWIFQSQKLNQLKSWMNEDERKAFTIDVAEIDMKRMLILSNYGLQKYILKENTEVPLPTNSNLLQSSSNNVYFSDIKWALKDGGSKHQKQRSIRDYKQIVLKSARVQEAIANELSGKTDIVDESALRRKVEKEADAIASEMFGEFRMPVVRFFAWALHKIFKSIYEKIYIDEVMLERLRKIEEQTKIPIVLVPTQRSYLDFLIVSYIFFVYRLKMPNVASDEVLLKTTLIPSLLRSSGGFFVRKEQYKKSKLYRAILTEYVESILTEGNNLEFFIEGSRSRTGKMLAPQLDILTIIVDAVMEERVVDVCIVPMTINYEKVLEGDTFPEELLGEQKVEESLLRVIKAAKLLKVNYGRVYIQFCEPIMFHNYVKESITADFNPYKRREQRKQLIENLGYYIVHRLSEKIVIMSTSVVSAVLLMNRKGVTEDFLINNVHWLSKEILARGYRIGGINKNSPNIAVRNAIAHLQNITVRTKKNVFELQISADEEYKKLLMLSYYRNSLTHVFLPEALIGFALVSFGSQMAYREGVGLERLSEQTFFLTSILRNQYIHPRELKTDQDFTRTLHQMIERKVISELKEDTITSKIVVDIRNDKLIHFYCSFLSPLVQAYWGTMQYLLSTKYERNEKNIELSLSKFEEYVQWHIESLYEEKVVDHYESCSMETLKNAIKTFEKMGLLSIRDGKQKKVEIVASEERLADLENHLRKFILNTKPISSPELMSRSVRYDLLGSKL